MSSTTQDGKYHFYRHHSWPSFTWANSVPNRVFGADGAEELGKKKNFQKSIENTRVYGDASQMVFLPNWDAAIAKCPVLGSDPSHRNGKEHFQGIYNGNAGWVKAVDTMIIIKRECERLGVKFAAGPSGTVVKLLRDAANGQRVVGAVAEDNTQWFADKVIVAAGAYCDTLLDFKGQLEAVRISMKKVIN